LYLAYFFMTMNASFVQNQKEENEIFGEMVKLFLMFSKYSTMNVFYLNVVTATRWYGNRILVWGWNTVRVRRSEEWWRNLGSGNIHWVGLNSGGAIPFARLVVIF